MPKPKRNKKGQFKSWPGGKSEKGSHKKFKKSLATRKVGRYTTPGGKVRVRTQAGTIYERKPNGSFRRVK
jgi:hypothetical protein